MIKIMSCNLNGIKGAMKKGFLDVVDDENPDIICIQETKTQYKNLSNELKNIENYNTYFHDSNVAGTRGTAIFSKIKPEKVYKGLGIEKEEGRLIRLDFEDFILITAYVPSGSNKEKLNHKHEFLRKFIEYIKDLKLKTEKNIIICGDFNIARDLIDLNNKKFKQAGFLPVEREMIKEILSYGFKDAFRELYPEEEIYTWIPYRYRNKGENKGLRLDYFFVNDSFMENIIDCQIKDYDISDHKQLFLEIEMEN